MRQLRVWGTLLLACLVAWPPCLAAPAAPRNATTTAKLTEAHGQIFKRGFVDWTKEAWGDPERAGLGDMLSEGMQLGTGRNSWAQVSWPSVTTRAWSESVFAIAPNQRLVYLLGGEILFNLSKHRKDKSDYVVWTKLLQARIRGTTVLLQSTPELSRITVLEGTVDVLNRLDHSVIRLTPGGVYEVRTAKTHASGDPSSIIDGVTTQMIRPTALLTPDTLHALSLIDQLQLSLLGSPVTSSQTPIAAGLRALFLDTLDADELLGALGLYSPLRSTLKGLREEIRSTITGLPLGQPLLDTLQTTAEPLKTSTVGIRQQAGGLLTTVNSTLPLAFKQILNPTTPAIPVFESLLSTTSLLVADKEGLLSHPLVTQFGSPLESVPLIQSALSHVDLELPLVGSHDAGMIQQTARLLSHTAQILRVPTASSFWIGQEVGTDLPLPNGALSLWTPLGVLGQTVDSGGLLGAGLLTVDPSRSLAGGPSTLSGAAALPGTMLAPVNATVTSISPTLGATTTALTSTVTSTVSNLATPISNTTSALTSTLNSVTAPILPPTQHPGGGGGMLNNVLNLLH